MGVSPEQAKENGKLGGRPQTYSDEYLNELAESLWEWIKKPTSVWFEAFAIERQIPSDRLVDFAKRNEKFAEAYHFAKQWQKLKLIEGGLMNKFNSNITKLLLAHGHGIRDQQEVHHQGAQPVEIVHFGKKEPVKWESNSQ